MQQIDLKDLIQFSKTYKNGFSFMYHKRTGLYRDITKNKKYHYIISYKTLIEIKYINLEKYIITVYEDSFNYIDNSKNDKILIGGFYDKTNNTYYIEINTYELTLNNAIITGKIFKQKYIYDNIKGECINVQE